MSHSPITVSFEYENGGELNDKDRVKMEAVTRYFLDNDLYPVFVILDYDCSPLVGEATVNLRQWTSNGLPMGTLRDMQNRPIQTPIFKAKAGIRKA
jgi:hypothetical protein